jgi:hypothetical protein
LQHHLLSIQLNVVITRLGSDHLDSCKKLSSCLCHGPLGSAVVDLGDVDVMHLQRSLGCRVSVAVAFSFVVVDFSKLSHFFALVGFDFFCNNFYTPQ